MVQRQLGERMIDGTPIDFLEYSFSLAYEKQKHVHESWRTVMRKLDGMRGGNVAHDAGNNDVYFDLILRQFEDEQALYWSQMGHRQTGSRVKIQIQFTRYWLVNFGEVLRAMKKAMPEEHENRNVIVDLLNLFEPFRMMIAKQEPRGIKEGQDILVAHLCETSADPSLSEVSATREAYVGNGSYNVKPIFNVENGSIQFPVYDAKEDEIPTMDRRSLSDYVLDELGV